MRRKQINLLPCTGIRVFALVIVFVISCCFGVSNAVDSSTRNGRDEVGKLLAFKKSSVEADPRGFLNNWNPDSWSPCSWNGVFCSTNGQVIELNITNAGLIGRLHNSDLMVWPNLTAIHFSGNFFYGNLSSDVETCSFEILDLSANNFSEFLDAESFLHSCDRLVLLNLSRNWVPGGNLKFGPSLQLLDLSWNMISDMDLLRNSGSNCNLKLLDVSHNSLTIGKYGGSLSILSSCKRLSSLDLSYNAFSGEIPANLMENTSDCRNLTELNFSFNSLEATHFPISLVNCQNLEELDFRNNALHLEIPGDLIRKFRKLSKLVLARNNFYGDIPPQLGHLCGTLEEIDLSENQLTGGLPSTFAFCSSLLSLNLGNNQLSDNFLGTIISSITNLRYLHLPFNNISGSIPESLKNFTQLQVLDLSANALTGNLPSEFCSAKTPYALEKIMLADNYLTGAVPRGLGLCRNLRVIDLSFNILSGPIPREIWTLPKLSDIVMWANDLSGEIPEGICIKAANIQTMILNNNLITGKIPESIANCTNLFWLSLFSNRLSGYIPSGIGNLDKLTVLQLVGRSLSLIWLELNGNFLTGTIPSELADQSGLLVPGIASTRSFVFIRNEIRTRCTGSGRLIELEGIRLQRLADFPPFRNCPSSRIIFRNIFYQSERNQSMLHFDLSHNYLSGPIPQSLGSMFSLTILNLGHNRLTGNIPYSLGGGMKSLSILDLSYNKLDGLIPGSLQMLSFLSDLDVSNNNLTGPIPLGGQLSTFPASRFENNSELCGIPMPPCGSNRNPGHPPRFEGHGIKHSSTFLHGFPLHFLLGFVHFFISSFCFFTLFGFGMRTTRRYRHNAHRRN
ncbi:hypothetical protein Pfo_000091 [Paulownia fortunei]|nr:hypothetical protein Pfo_000091 [Paulownia fortunei]